jgi:hypothetical protein
MAYAGSYHSYAFFITHVDRVLIFIDPPGCNIAVIPASAASSAQSGNGKKHQMP